MQSVLQKIVKRANYLYFLREIEDSCHKTAAYIPDYPDEFVKKMFKLSDVSIKDIEDKFYVSEKRAIEYAYCNKVSPLIKYQLIKYYVEEAIKNSK